MRPAGASASWKRTVCVGSTLLAAHLAACSGPKTPQTLSVVAGGEPVSAALAPAHVSASRTPTIAPTAASSPAPPRQRFVDPPLPPELAQDGALAPLPPRPVITASGQGSQN